MLAGRPKGVLNKATREARLAAALIVDDPEYRKQVLIRARAGTLSPAVEVMLWHYRYGKPKEVVEIQDLRSVDLTETSTTDLAARAEQIASDLRQAQILADAALRVTRESDAERAEAEETRLQKEFSDVSNAA